MWTIRLLSQTELRIVKIPQRTKYIPVPKPPTVPAWERVNAAAPLSLLCSIPWTQLLNWGIFRLMIFCQYNDAMNNLTHTPFFPCKSKGKHLSKIYLIMLTFSWALKHVSQHAWQHSGLSDFPFLSIWLVKKFNFPPYYTKWD